LPSVYYGLGVVPGAGDPMVLGQECSFPEEWWRKRANRITNNLMSAIL
jgi:hypothetical protein